MAVAAPQATSQVQIPEQAQKLKRSTLVVSAIAMGTAVAYAVEKDVITMFVALALMFATLSRISALNRLRKPLGGK